MNELTRVDTRPVEACGYQLVENFDFGGWYDDSDSEVYESEDTMSILNRYIEEADINLDKSVIQPIKSKTLNQKAPRPPKTGFIIDKARKDLDYNPKTITETL